MTERRLPVKQLAILSICRFAEPLTLTSVFPYLPEMIESFGVPKNDIARWAGLTSAISSICQCFTAIFWGTASDRFGRKPTILLGLLSTVTTTLIWGFSTSLPMAMAARAVQGLGNGNVGILRTTVAELCPWKELQPRAFSIMPLVYNVGAVIGPMMGGALSNPLGVDPLKPRGKKLLEKYPYCVPNLVAASFFVISIVTGWLFLKETLESKKNAPDRGRIIGAKITAWVRKTFNISKRPKKIHPDREPLLKAIDGEETAHDGSADHAISPILPPPTVRDVLSYQTSLNLFIYTLLAFYIIGYDQLLPVFMHHPPQSIDDPNVKLPLKFAGGFGIGSRRIGVIFTFFSISSTMCQFLVFPPVARYLGILTCLRISFLIFPVVYFVTPFISLLPTQFSKEVAMVVVLSVRGVGGSFAFPCSTIMLTNSAPSLRLLGTINGVATSVGAFGRAIGPAVSGNLFTFGVKHGYVGLPFWTMSLVAFLAWIPTLWLEEGTGFGDDPDSDEEDVISASASSGSSISSRVLKSTRPNEDPDVLSESEYGELGDLLSHTSTRSSLALASDEESDQSDDDGGAAHGHGHGHRHHNRRLSSDSTGHVRSRSNNGRRSRTVRRRSSVPVGMGIGFRRLSSNIGSTGLGVGGASWGGT